MNNNEVPTEPQDVGNQDADAEHNKNTQQSVKRSYASLFSDNRAHDESSLLQYIQQPSGDIQLASNETESVEDAHGYCLVGYVYGSRPGPFAFVNFVKGWGKNVKFVFKDNGWIKFQFPNAEDRDRILRGGPYLIHGRQLFIKLLPAYFLYKKEDMLLLPSWVQILGLPAECWTTLALSKIASMVGKPIQTDKMTITKQGSSYARVLVELDAQKPRIWEQTVVLPNGIPIPIKFRYELDPKYCDKCNSLGHTTNMCGLEANRRTQKWKTTIVPPAVSPIASVTETEHHSRQVLPPTEDIVDQAQTMSNDGVDDALDNTMSTDVRDLSKIPADNNLPEEYTQQIVDEAYNSEPCGNMGDMDNLDDMDMYDTHSCGEWVTVDNKKKMKLRKGKAKAIFFETPITPFLRSPLTRSQSILLQQKPIEVRLPRTAFFNP